MTEAATPVARLEQTWSRPPGFLGWVTDVRHRSIGLRYILTGSTFFVLAGVAAILMRIQLAMPENDFLDPELYNQLFTMHGATMMFLFAIPIMEGIGIYLVPLMIGARDMAFPRLNAFGYWVYLISGTTLWISLFAGVAPNSGWFNYPPLGTGRFQPGLNIDFYGAVISMLEIAALVAAVELIVTILKQRAPGMRLNRIPLFVWSELVLAFMVIFAMPALIVASLLLEMDSKLGTSFYLMSGGGDPLLWQHLFWFFGHPEVYIMLLPGLGIVSTLVATFSGRRVVGYPFVVASFVAIGMASFGVWVHHMFATFRAQAAMSLFSVATFSIAIPSGIQIFATLATLWYGRMRVTVPLLYVFGFIFVFVLGGITGVNVASIPLDLQVHDTYFVVAHFHYVILGGVLLPLLGGLYYWFPKISGRMLNRRLGLAAFWTKLVGINVVFFPMHLSGLWGMPRRVYTYLPGLGWDTLNALSTVGAFVMAAGVALYLLNVAWSLRRGDRAGENPWQAGTLEWSMSSPPPPHVFASVPVVGDRHPLWAIPSVSAPTAEADGSELATSVDRRETLGTSPIEAQPEQRVVQPQSTYRPLLCAGAVAVAFIGMIYEPWLVAVGLILTAAALVLWSRPQQAGEWDRNWLRKGPEGSLPTNYVASAFGTRSPTWWGAVFTCVIVGVVFVALFTSYFYLRGKNAVWPIPPVEVRDPLGPLLASLALWSAVVPLLMARRYVKQENRRSAAISLWAAGGLALLFLLLRVVEYEGLPFNYATNVSAAIEWAITGFHFLAVVAVVGAVTVVGIDTLRGRFHAERSDEVDATVLFGSFVAALWVFAYLIIYISPRVI